MIQFLQSFDRPHDVVACCDRGAAVAVLVHTEDMALPVIIEKRGESWAQPGLVQGGPLPRGARELSTTPAALLSDLALTKSGWPDSAGRRPA